MIDDHTFGVPDPRGERRLARWYRRNRPAVLATLWLWILFLILALVTLFTGWASLLVTLAIQTLLSLAAGGLAAWIYHPKPVEGTSHARQGALAGIFLPLTTGIVILVAAILIGIGSFGTLVPLMLPYFVALPGAVILSGGLGWAGGWLMQRILEKRPRATK
jgi:hypothetical protein